MKYLLVLLLAPFLISATVAPSFTAYGGSVREGSTGSLVIQKSGKASSYSYVTVTVRDGTAKAGVDFKPIPTQRLTFGNNVLTMSIPVVTINNSTYQGNRTFTYTIAINRYGTVAKNIGTITIMDDETSAPPPPPPPPTNVWVAAPLQDGGFARVTKADDSEWSVTGAGKGRPLVVGEIVAIYFNGWGFTVNGQTSFAIRAFSDGSEGRALAVNLEGIAPVGTPPDLPANWWIPGRVQALKTCPDIRNGGPGVVQGGVYRAAMLSGTHTQLAVGQFGTAGVLWQISAADDHNFTAQVVVPGDCIAGQ